MLAKQDTQTVYVVACQPRDLVQQGVIRMDLVDPPSKIPGGEFRRYILYQDLTADAVVRVVDLYRWFKLRIADQTAPPQRQCLKRHNPQRHDIQRVVVADKLSGVFRLQPGGSIQGTEFGSRSGDLGINHCRNPPDPGPANEPATAKGAKS